LKSLSFDYKAILKKPKSESFKVPRSSIKMFETLMSQ